MADSTTRQPESERLPDAGPPMAAPGLRGDQLELLWWMQRNAPSLAELYEGSVLMLQHRSPGHVRLIAHSVREIRNRLPEYVSKVRSGGRLDDKGLIDNISKIWAAEPIRKLLRDWLNSRTSSPSVVSNTNEKPCAYASHFPSHEPLWFARRAVKARQQMRPSVEGLASSVSRGARPSSLVPRARW